MRLLPVGTLSVALLASLLSLTARTAFGQLAPSHTVEGGSAAAVRSGQLRYLLASPQGVERGALHAELVGSKAALRQLQREGDRYTTAKNDLIAHLRFGTQPLPLDSVAPRLALVVQTRSSLPVAPAWYRLGNPNDDVADMYVKVLDPAMPRDAWTLQEGYLVIEASAHTTASGRLGAVFRSADGQTLTLSGRFTAVTPTRTRPGR